MDLGLSDEQRQLVTSFGNLLSKASSAEQVRAGTSEVQRNIIAQRRCGLPRS